MIRNELINSKVLGDKMLYARRTIKPVTDVQNFNSVGRIDPVNETMKIDAKNWTIESTGLITWVVVIGTFVALGFVIYGKYFHERVRGWNYARKRRKTKAKKN